jgi:ABC-type transporter Mla MlaB component
MPLEPASDVVARGYALPPPLACSYTNGGLDAAWVQLAGELDIATAPQLLRTSQAQRDVRDLRELAFIDSCGMHAIVSAGSRARQASRRLVRLRVPSGSHFREWGSPSSSGELSRYRHDPVDRGALKGSTSWRP